MFKESDQSGETHHGRKSGASSVPGAAKPIISRRAAITAFHHAFSSLALNLGNDEEARSEANALHEAANALGNDYFRRTKPLAAASAIRQLIDGAERFQQKHMRTKQPERLVLAIEFLKKEEARLRAAATTN